MVETKKRKKVKSFPVLLCVSAGVCKDVCESVGESENSGSDEADRGNDQSVHVGS